MVEAAYRAIAKAAELIDMRKHKSELYEQLSKNKSSGEFLKYFFTYSPSLTKTQRAKVRGQLRKTQKKRMESAY